MVICFQLFSFPPITSELKSAYLQMMNIRGQATDQNVSIRISTSKQVIIFNNILRHLLFLTLYNKDNPTILELGIDF